LHLQFLLCFFLIGISPSPWQVGIDAYSWLHKGAYSCSMELCMNPKSAGARRYISYFMHHVNLLRHHKVVPVVVFDGGSMPCKAATDKDRHKYATSNCQTTWLRNAVPFRPFFSVVASVGY
jgi:hypothetical protein